MKGLLKSKPILTKNIIKSLNSKNPVKFNLNLRELSPIIGSTIISSAFIITCMKLTSLSPEMIYKRVAPSIVTVSSYGIHRDPFSPDGMIEYSQGTGTGFSFGGEGYIVTNNHVINDAFDIKISTRPKVKSFETLASQSSFTIQDEKEFDVQIVGKDEKHDIALLHISDSQSSSAKLLPNLKKCINTATVGESVLAIGNPFGFDHSMTSGIISGLQRDLESEDKPPFINLLQTDAAINPGNSGGPLLDATSGCLLGVNTAIVSPSGANSGVGFAIPIDRVNNIVNMIQGKIEAKKQFN